MNSPAETTGASVSTTVNVEWHEATIRALRVTRPGQFIADLSAAEVPRAKLAASLAPLLEARTYRDALDCSRTVLHRVRSGRSATLTVRAPYKSFIGSRTLLEPEWLLHVHGKTRLPGSKSVRDALNIALNYRLLPSAVVLRTPGSTVEILWALARDYEESLEDERFGLWSALWEFFPGRRYDVRIHNFVGKLPMWGPTRKLSSASQFPPHQFPEQGWIEELRRYESGDFKQMEEPGGNNGPKVNPNA